MAHEPTAPRVAAILVVDQVASTHFLVTHGDSVAGQVNAEHGDAMHRIVDALGGRVEGSTGDGYFASFQLGSAALDAAVEIQRTAQRLSEGYPEPVHLRIGLAIGEVHHDGIDLRGWPLFLATRLCDQAVDGTILASRTLLDVVATRSTHARGEARILDLKGIGHPTEAVEIEWQLADETDDVALDPELAVLEERAWVGRADTLAALLDAVTSAQPPRLVAVSGEAGAGKSRLIARFAAEAARQGHRVLYGAAPRGRHSSYAPIISALRGALEALRPDVRGSVLVGTAGRELSRLLPDLGGPGRAVLHPTDGPGAHRLLMEGIAEVIQRLADHGGGLTFVVDDMQWADDATLATLRHLTGPAGPQPLTVVASIRSADVGLLTELMADVSRHNRVVRLDVEGLDPAEIADLISETRPQLDHQQVARTADQLAARTGGNALFVTSMVQHFDWLDEEVAGDNDRELPTELSVAIAERLSGVDSDDTAALSTASVIGQRFAPRLLADAIGRPPEAIAGIVGRARQSGLLQDVGGGDVAFIHDLVRVALMPPDDSFELAVVHRAIAEQLEQRPDPDIGATAGHFLGGLAAGVDRDKAIDWTTRAARQAVRRLSYGEAIAHYRDAIALLGPGDQRGPALALNLGRAQLYGGDPGYRRTLLDAVDRCLEAGLADLAAEAALANNRGLYSAAGEVDQDRIDALLRVLAVEHEPAVRSELTATLAVESVFTGASPDDLAALSLEAVELARESGDRAALVRALTLRQDSNYRIDNLAER
ncbi:MAG: AAA family ATPase, partial [Acidimicrobiia bacterium]|nr:AAA family ATPase [Acidimicrobiia bacterium]